MTDKQIEIILSLIADKFAGCKDMDEVKKAIEELRVMAEKGSVTDYTYTYPEGFFELFGSGTDLGLDERPSELFFKV